MSNMQKAGPNSGDNNNKVDDMYNSGNKNVIDKCATVHGNPIVGDQSGNRINSGNKTTEVRGKPVIGPFNDNRNTNSHNINKSNNTMNSNVGNGVNVGNGGNTVSGSYSF